MMRGEIHPRCDRFEAEEGVDEAITFFLFARLSGCPHLWPFVPAHDDDDDDDDVDDDDEGVRRIYLRRI